MECSRVLCVYEKKTHTHIQKKDKKFFIITNWKIYIEDEEETTLRIGKQNFYGFIDWESHEYREREKIQTEMKRDKKKVFFSSSSSKFRIKNWMKNDDDDDDDEVFCWWFYFSIYL